MTRKAPRLAALAVAAAASAMLIGGATQAGEPLNQDGAPGEPGSATSHCRNVPLQDDDGSTQCTARPGMPGAPGPATQH